MSELLGTPSSAIHLDADGNVYAGGYSSEDEKLFVLSKYDSEGNELWTVTHDGENGADYFLLYQIAVSADGHTHLTGSVNAEGGTTRGLVAKFDAQGTLLWEHHSAEIWAGYAIEIDPNGGVYISGRLQSTSGFSMAVQKFKEDGTSEWLVRWEAFASQRTILLVRPEGGVFVVWSEFEPEGYRKHSVIAYNDDGAWRAREDYFYRGRS